MALFDEYIHVPLGYRHSFNDGVHAVLTEQFKNRLDPFLEKYRHIQHTENYAFLPDDKIRDFPFVEFDPYKNELFSRRQDLTLLEPLLQKRSSVLEIGGWNGWLTRRLGEKIKDVVSVDIFNDPQNGLGSRKFHTGANWLSVQADIDDLSIYAKKFDLVIFNHCLHFYDNPFELSNRYLSLLNNKGAMVILGVDVYRDKKNKEAAIAAERAHYRTKHGFEIHFYDCPGYFSSDLYEQFRKTNFVFSNYKVSSVSKLKQVLLSEKHGILIKQL